MEAQRVTHPFFTWYKKDNRGPQTSIEGDDALTKIFDYYTAAGAPRVRNEEAVRTLEPFMISLDGVTTSPVSAEEVMEGIKAMGNDKSPGTNGITAEVLKHELLIELCSEAILKEWEKMKSGEVPHITWNEGRVQLFYKNKGSPDDVRMYRPITLLNIHER